MFRLVQTFPLFPFGESQDLNVVIFIFHIIVCFAGTKWEGHVKDLKDLKKILSKNPEKLKLIKDFLGNSTTTIPLPGGTKSSNLYDICSMYYKT